MSKKLINIMILFLGIQLLFAGFSHCEAKSNNVNLSVSSATGNVGDEVTININLNNTANFVSTNLVLNYDTEYLEYVSHTEGEVLKQGAMNIVKNNSETGKIAIGYVSDPNSTDTTVQAGNILKIVFKLKTKLEQETKLVLDCDSLKDKDGTNVTATITNGKIQKVMSPNTDNNEKNDTILPQTGKNEETIFKIAFIVLISTSIISYKKNKNLRDII